MPAADPYVVGQAMTVITLLARNATPIVATGVAKKLPKSKIVAGVQEYIDAMLKEVDAIGLPKPIVEFYFEEDTDLGEHPVLGPIGAATFTFRAEADPNHWSYDPLGGKDFKIGEESR